MAPPLHSDARWTFSTARPRAVPRSRSPSRIVGGGTALAAILRTPSRDLVRGVVGAQVPRRARRSTPARLLTPGRGADPHLRAPRRDAARSLGDRRCRCRAPRSPRSSTAPMRRLSRALLEASPASRGSSASAPPPTSGPAAAELAPAMGMVGTLIGLVRLFTTMTDPAAIGGAMAIAVLATLYGALIGNLVCLPVATAAQAPRARGIYRARPARRRRSPRLPRARRRGARELRGMTADQLLDDEPRRADLADHARRRHAAAGRLLRLPSGQHDATRKQIADGLREGFGARRRCRRWRSTPTRSRGFAPGSAALPPTRRRRAGPAPPRATRARSSRITGGTDGSPQDVDPATGIGRDPRRRPRPRRRRAVVARRAARRASPSIPRHRRRPRRPAHLAFAGETDNDPPAPDPRRAAPLRLRSRAAPAAASRTPPRSTSRSPPSPASAIGEEGGARTAVDPRLKLAACPLPQLDWRSTLPGRGGRHAAMAPAWRIYVPIKLAPQAAQPVVAAAAAPVAPASKPETVIKRGDPITIEVGAAGFSITRDGVAMGDAPAGGRSAGQGRSRQAADPGGRGRNRPRDAAWLDALTSPRRFFLKLLVQGSFVRVNEAIRGTEAMVDPVGIKATASVDRRLAPVAPVSAVQKAQARGADRGRRRGIEPAGADRSPPRRRRRSTSSASRKIKKAVAGRQVPADPVDHRRPADRAEAAVESQ